ncbi:MAG: hypothetical protein ACI9EF_000365 [Pseudohongiellaceae bacterium]|jgi:hypothetical protein
MITSLLIAALFVAPTALVTDHIAWFTSLDDAIAEAKQANRPILVHSAAPSCQEVPGIW